MKSLFWVWGFILGVPIFFFSLLGFLCFQSSEYIRKKGALDTGIILKILWAAFLLTIFSSSLIIYGLASRYVRNDVFLQDIIRFYFTLPLFLPAVFIMLFALLNVMVRPIWSFRFRMKYQGAAVDKKAYTFGRPLMTIFFVLTALTLFFVFKISDYVYMAQRIDSLRASEKELKKAYYRASRHSPSYWRLLPSIALNKNCPPEILTAFIDDMDKMQIGSTTQLLVLYNAAENPNFPADARPRMSDKIEELEQKAEKIAGQGKLVRTAKTDADKQRILEEIENSPQKPMTDIIKTMRSQYVEIKGTKYFFSEPYIHDLLIDIAEDPATSIEVLKRLSVLSYPYRTVRDKAIYRLRQRE
jgi:ABC-type multidrug transport system fused ATPase/permease subunit